LINRSVQLNSIHSFVYGVVNSIFGDRKAPVVELVETNDDTSTSSVTDGIITPVFELVEKNTRKKKNNKQ
jgi:hypothetical protein